MDDAIWWFGALHASAYLLGAFLASSFVAVEWGLRKVNLHRKVLMALWLYYKNKHEVQQALEREAERKAARREPSA